MRRIFADTAYWIALIHRKDQWHQRAAELSQQLHLIGLVTTDEVLSEFLTFFSGHGIQMRELSANIVEKLLKAPQVEVIEQSRQSFLGGLALYESRNDKSYSLIDCISMTTMRQISITEILTHDVHFSQEGFTILF